MEQLVILEEHPRSQGLQPRLIVYPTILSFLRLRNPSQLLKKKATVRAPSEPRSSPTLTAVNPDSSKTPTLPPVSDSTPQSPSRQTPPHSAFHQSAIQTPPPKAGAQDAEQGKSGRQARAEDRDDATSCETAAWIIASLRGHDNAEEVRAELGCSSNADCTVKNLTVFHAMDR